MHVQRLLAQFHDNEVDDSLRRIIHEHVVTCVECTRALTVLEEEQELLRKTINESIENLEFSGFWEGVEQKISEQQSQSQWQWRRQLWWETWRSLWSWPTPAWVVTSAAVLFIGLAVFTRQRQVPPPSSPPLFAEQESPLQMTDNDQAQIESLSASDIVSVWNEPTHHSTVIWVRDEGEGEE